MNFNTPLPKSLLLITVALTSAPALFAQRSGGLTGGLRRAFDKGERAANRAEKDPGSETVTSPEGVAPTPPEFQSKFLDESILIHEMLANGASRETRIDHKSTSSSFTSSDGRFSVKTWYGPKGEVVKQTISGPESTTEYIRNEDGTSTETRVDRDNKPISTVTRSEDGRLLKGERRVDGGTETAERQRDGSLRFEAQDPSGKTIRSRVVDADGNGYTDINHETGVKRESSRTRDALGKTTAIATTTENPDGSSTTRRSDLKGTETVEKKDGKVVRRTAYNQHNGKRTNTEFGPDGKLLRKVETKRDGSTRERWRNPDGSFEGLELDADGNVKETYRKQKDGTTVHSKSGKWWTKETTVSPDGSKKVTVQQNFGSKSRIIIERDAAGKITGSHRSNNPAANDTDGLPPFSASAYAKQREAEAKLRTENEKELRELRNETPLVTPELKEDAATAPEIPAASVAKTTKSDQKRRRTELETKSATFAAKAKELQTELDRALKAGDRAKIRRVESAMDANMDRSLVVDSELLQLNARQNDIRDEARYRVAKFLRKDAGARARDMNNMDDELEDHTQAVAGKFGWISAGAEITTKTTREARSADARRNLGTANLDAIKRLETMPGLLELQLGDLRKNPDALAAAKKFLEGRRDFARNQVEMGTSERRTITAIRAAGTAADLLDTLVGGKIASGGGKLATRGLNALKGAKAVTHAPSVAKLSRVAGETADTLLDAGRGARKAAGETTGTLIDGAGRVSRQADADGLVRVTMSSPTRWIPVHELEEFTLNELVTDSTIIMRGVRPARLTAGHLSANTSQATIARLWEKGRNLTRSEILIKVDLILSGKVPPTGPR